MADPHHVPELDAFDRLTVVLYRSGIVVAAVGLAWLAADPLLPGPAWIPRAFVLSGAALTVADMHLYDKRIRWVIGAAAWVGAGLSFVGASLSGVAAHWVGIAGLGFLFVTLSALALKEQFCFKVPALRLVPGLLALSLVPLVAGWAWPASGLLGLAALIYAALAVAKLRMPLHFDVGNKAAYQI